MKNGFVPIVALLLGGSANVSAASEEAPVLSVYKTPALMEIQFTSENGFSAEEIYQIEETTTQYLQELLTNADSLRFLEGSDSVIDLSVNVQTQEMFGNDISLVSEVDLIHYGEVGISDMGALLTFLVNQNNTESSSIYLDSIIPTASVELISFDFVSESIPVVTDLTTLSSYTELFNARESKRKMLSFVTAVLSITLFGMSAILIWIGGGWLVLRKKVKHLLLREEELTRMTVANIESKPTTDTDEESPTNAERNNNGRPNLSSYGFGVKTPGKSNGGVPQTPMSGGSEYSDTDRAPIGIMSMRKLIPSLQRSHNDSDSDDEESNMTDGMKKLEY